MTAHQEMVSLVSWTLALEEMDPRAYGEPSQFKLDGIVADVLHEHKPAFVYGDQPLSFPSSSKPLFTTTLTF